MDIRKIFHEIFLVFFLLCNDPGLSSVMDDMDYFDEPSPNRCPWIRNKLKNGRVRYRYKGRVAKFLCDSGFELAGKRSSTCVRGQWSNPVPVCVARGCVRVPSISNGRITEMYRGALVTYDCNPGYVLDGNPTIHCDGRRWNTQPPSCVKATDRPETYCDFENPDLCGWSQDPNHDFDWTRNQFATPSGHVGTGPAFDHTFGENKGGFYLYIEASSPRKLNDTARLFSPVYPPNYSGGCFIFWYHMYGATTGGLRIYLKPESHVFDELRPKWEKYGDLGNQWLKGHMVVPVLQENFQIVIEGLRGASYVGDSAIDDVRISSNLCDSDDNTTDVIENVDQYSCRGRCQESGNETFCGCNANCVDEDNFCCRDYHAICTTGNFSTIRYTDEPLPEDYSTTSLLASQSVHYTTTDHSDERPIATTQLQTEKSEITSETSFSSSSILLSTDSLQPGATTKILFPNSHPTNDDDSSEQHTNTEATHSTDISSTVLSSEPPLISTKHSETTQTVLTDSPTSSSSKATSIIQTLPAITTTTPLSTTMSSTTSQTTSTTFLTSSTTESTTETTRLTAEQTNPEITSKTSISTSKLDETTHSIPITASLSNTEKITSSSTILSDVQKSTTSAATVTNREPVSLSTLATSSTRKIYNLRPRVRTVSTTDIDISSSTRPTSRIYTDIKESTIASTAVTSTSRFTSWYKYSVSPTAKQKSISSTMATTTRASLQETTSENILITNKFSNQITRPTISTLPKSSDSYELKSTTASGSSNAPLVVSIIIVVLLCLIVALAYYIKKHRSKRQSKLSDDSEMRFLPDSDYMEYSDASALDRILEK